MDVAGVIARKLVVQMGAVFDLRKLLVPLDVVAEAAASVALEKIHAAAVQSGVRLAALDVLHAQLAELRRRLVAAATSLPYNMRDQLDQQRGGAQVEVDQCGWFKADGTPKSGTVVMKALFQVDEETRAVPEISKGLGQILYLFQHCALKSKNESNVEGFGSTIERHASKLRGNQDQANYANEAFIHINGPLVHDADYIIERALNMHFGKDKDGKQKPWHFTNTVGSLYKNANVLKNVGLSKVMKRLYETKSKVSFTAAKRRKVTEGGGASGYANRST